MNLVNFFRHLQKKNISTRQFYRINFFNDLDFWGCFRGCKRGCCGGLSLRCWEEEQVVSPFCLRARRALTLTITRVTSGDGWTAGTVGPARPLLRRYVKAQFIPPVFRRCYVHFHVCYSTLQRGTTRGFEAWFLNHGKSILMVFMVDFESCRRFEGWNNWDLKIFVNMTMILGSG